MVVHGGHVLATDDPAVGVDNWRKTFTYQAKNGGFPLPLFIENTAGGGNAMARELDGDRPAVGRDRRVRRGLRARHVPRVGRRLGPRYRGRRHPGDHRPGGPRPPEQQPRPARLQPRPARTARRGRDPDGATLEVARAADCPIVLETPGDAAAHAGEIVLCGAPSAEPRRTTRRPCSVSRSRGAVQDAARGVVHPGPRRPARRHRRDAGRRATTRAISARTAMSRSSTPRKNHCTPMPRFCVPR